MQKLTQLFSTKPRTFSFELFPPKTPEGYEKLWHTVSQLCKLKPDFISCTYGAGGSSRGKTLEIVQNIESKFQTIGVAHLTCVMHTKDEIQNILRDIKSANISNVLALRGDPPKDHPNWKPGPENFQYSSELVEFMRTSFKDYFGIGVAGFPEGHMLCPDREQDAKFLKLKIDAGADFIITQLFFDNKDYFDYVARLRKLGISSRIIPGILPITDYNGLIRFCATCGATIPQEVHDIFKPIASDPQKTLEAGIKYCIDQCRQLLTLGAPGIHFYTLNKVEPVSTIINKLRGQ